MLSPLHNTAPPGVPPSPVPKSVLAAGRLSASSAPRAVFAVMSVVDYRRDKKVRATVVCSYYVHITMYRPVSHLSLVPYPILSPLPCPSSGHTSVLYRSDVLPLPWLRITSTSCNTPRRPHPCSVPWNVRGSPALTVTAMGRCRRARRETIHSVAVCRTSLLSHLPLHPCWPLPLHLSQQ